jgi:cell division protein FtsL
MKKGRRVKLLPASIALTMISVGIYVPGTLFTKQTNIDLSMKIQDIEKEIEGFELMNQELELEVAILRGG